MRHAPAFQDKSSPTPRVRVMVMLPAGSAVNLGGLKGRPELNGTRGTVVAFHADKGRYAIRLPSAEKILLRPENLQPAPASSLLEPLADLRQQSHVPPAHPRRCERRTRD